MFVCVPTDVACTCVFLWNVLGSTCWVAEVFVLRCLTFSIIYAVTCCCMSVILKQNHSYYKKLIPFIKIPRFWRWSFTMEITNCCKLYFRHQIICGHEPQNNVKLLTPWIVSGLCCVDNVPCHCVGGGCFVYSLPNQTRVNAASYCLDLFACQHCLCHHRNCPHYRSLNTFLVCLFV